MAPPSHGAYCYVEPTMTRNDLELVLHFLQRTVARGAEEDLLCDLVARIEKEINKWNKKPPT